MGNSQQFAKVMYGPEASAYGTEAVSYASLARVEECSIDSDNGLIYDYGLGDGVNAAKAYWGPFNATGRIRYKPVDFDFLKHWVGNKTGSGTSGSHYILTEATQITAGAGGAGIMVPFSVEKQNIEGSSTLVEYATGCVGTSFTISGTIGQPIYVEANFIAQKTGFRTSATGTYSASTSASFLVLGGTWKWGATPSALSGVRDFSITYNNGLVGEGDETRTIDSRFRGIPNLGQRSYNFSVTIIMTSSLAATLISDFYGDASSPYLPADGSTTSGPTASLEFKVELVSGGLYSYLQLDETSINRISQPVALGGGLQLLTIEGQGLKGLGNVPIEWWA